MDDFDMNMKELAKGLADLKTLMTSMVSALVAMQQELRAQNEALARFMEERTHR